MAYRQKEYNYNDKLTKNQNLLMDKLYKMRMSGMAEVFMISQIVQFLITQIV
nr:hypothetical protein [Mediterraneibacter faecis]